MFAQAYSVRFCISFYLNTNGHLSGRELEASSSLRRIGRLAFWLLLSSLALFVHIVAMAYSLALYSSVLEVSPTGWLVGIALFCFSRVMVSYTQAVFS